MSSHQMTIVSPKLGSVQVQAGWDAAMNEAYLTFEGERSYLSPSGLTVDQLQPLADEKLGVQLPQTMIDLIHSDLADVRMGEQDVNRRVYRYDEAGNLIVGLSI